MFYSCDIGCIISPAAFIGSWLVCDGQNPVLKDTASSTSVQTFEKHLRSLTWDNQLGVGLCHRLFASRFPLSSVTKCTDFPKPRIVGAIRHLQLHSMATVYLWKPSTFKKTFPLQICKTACYKQTSWRLLGYQQFHGFGTFGLTLNLSKSYSKLFLYENTAAVVHESSKSKSNAVVHVFCVDPGTCWHNWLAIE